MKKTVFLVCIAAIALANISHAELDLDKVMAIWSFDEGQDDTVADASGNGSHGTLKNGPEWVKGKFGMALSFDGDNDFVEINDSMTPEGTSHTISIWVNPGKDQKEWVDLLGSHTGGRKGYHIEQLANATNEFYHGLSEAGGWNNGAAATTLLVAGEWQHFVIVRDGTVIVHYLNGKESQRDATFRDNPIADSGKNLRIGFATCCANREFNGIIDEVVMFNRALDEDEIDILAGGIAPQSVSSKDRLTTTWGNIKANHGRD